MIHFRKSLLQLLLPVILTGCMSGPDLSARFTGRSEKAWKDAFLAARMAEQKGDLMRASVAYEELLQKYPEKAEAHHRLGILCQKNGRSEDAIQHLSRAHQIAPMDIEVLCDLGYVHYLQNRPKDAVDTLQKAQQINPGHQRTQANLAVALIALDQVPSAVALLRQNMGEAPAATMVGFALAQRGELGEARKYFSQALDADASNQPAAEALVQIEEMLNSQEQQAEQTAVAAEDSGVVAAGQIAALPFEVISEGVVTRPTPATATAATTQTTPARGSSGVLPAAASSANSTGAIQQTVATASSTSQPDHTNSLPSLKVASPVLGTASSASPASAGSGAEKKTESPIVIVRDETASQPLPPVAASGSWRPRPRTTVEPGPGHIIQAGLSQHSVREDESDGFSAEFGESVELPPVDAAMPLPAVDEVDVPPVYMGTRGRSIGAAPQPLRSSQIIPSVAVAAAPRRAVEPRISVPEKAQTAETGESGKQIVEMPATATTAATATAAVNPTPTTRGAVGGLPLAFLRAMYLQMNEEQKAVFWKDLRRVPEQVSDAELGTYRELALSTENLPRVEAAITLLAVFHEDQLAAELLKNLEKSEDPVVRQAASTAVSMLQIRQNEQQAK